MAGRWVQEAGGAKNFPINGSQLGPSMRDSHWDMRCAKESGVGEVYHDQWYGRGQDGDLGSVWAGKR